MMIKRYKIVSEQGVWITVIDEELAKQWVQLAKSGGCKNMQWRGEEYWIEEHTLLGDDQVWSF